MADLLSRLEETRLRCQGLEERLALPETAANPALFQKLMKEYTSLTPILSEYESYREAEKRGKEAEELLTVEGDAELRALAAEELEAAREECRARYARLEEKVRSFFNPPDPNDEKNVVVEIRAGAGGEEAALFAAELYRMYGMFADAEGYTVEPVSRNETGLGGFREITFLVEGEGAYSRLKYESGVHRVQRVPQTETQGRIHTSTVTVAVLPEAEEVEVEINPADLKIESIKSSGAGGQHINKTESAVRILHRPSGLVVECQEERSQFKNRDKALKLLRSRLLSLRREEQEGKIAAERRGQVGTGDRSEKIRTYNFPQSRVTDHRIGYTSHDLAGFLNGGIGQLIDALASAEAAEKLKKTEET